MSDHERVSNDSRKQGGGVRSGRMVEGSIVLLTTSCDVKYQGKVHTINPTVGLISLYQVTCVTSNSKQAGLMHFYRDDIYALEVISDAKAKLNEKKCDKDSADRPSDLVDDLSSTSSRGSVAVCNEVKRTTDETSTRLNPSQQQTSYSGSLWEDIQDEEEEEERVLSDAHAQCVVLDNVEDDSFHIAIMGIRQSPVIGLAVEGKNIGRYGELYWIQIAINGYVLLFDMVKLGDRAFKAGLKMILEDSKVQKVVHDCRAVSDMLFHKYRTNLVNVFDTQVADIRVHMMNNRGELPRGTSSLVVCLTEHLNLPVEKLCLYKMREKKLHDSEGRLWLERPLSTEMLELCVMNAVYLRDLRTYLMERMLSEYTDGCDVFLSLHRDASNDTVLRLQNLIHTVPDEFRNLAWHAKESRMLTRRHRQNRINPDERTAKLVKADKKSADQIKENNEQNVQTREFACQTDANKKTSQPDKRHAGKVKQSTFSDGEAVSQTNSVRKPVGALMVDIPPCEGERGGVEKWERGGGELGMIVPAGHEPTWLYEKSGEHKKSPASQKCSSSRQDVMGGGGDWRGVQSGDSGAGSSPTSDPDNKTFAQYSTRPSLLSKSTNQTTADKPKLHGFGRGINMLHRDSSANVGRLANQMSAVSLSTNEQAVRMYGRGDNAVLARGAEDVKSQVKPCVSQVQPSGVPREVSGVPREASGVPREASDVPREVPGVPREAPGAPREASGVAREILGKALVGMGRGSAMLAVIENNIKP